MFDKIVATTMILAGIFCTHYVAFEYGKKRQCEIDKDYLYEMDFARCVKIGWRNYK